MGSATLLSRFLGLARDVLVGHILGARAVSDAFYVAFRIPNLLRDLLGEGSLSNAFVPVFCKEHEQGGKEASFRLASAVFWTLLLILAALSALGILAAEPIVRLFTFEFGPRTPLLDLTIELTRIMFPFMLFVGLAALAMGMLNSLHWFFVPALAPSAWNVVQISTALYLNIAGLPLEAAVRVLAWSVVAGGVLQFLVQVPALVAEGFRFRPVFAHPGRDAVLRLMVPAAFGQSVTQITLLVQTIVGWLIGEGAITALFYANRLMQFPLGILGVSLAQVAAPAFARQVATGATKEAILGTVHRTLRLALFLMLPATAGLIALSFPISRLLFLHGNLDEAAVRRIAWALDYYAAGLFFFAAVKTIVPLFYALEDTRVPVLAAVRAMMVNVVLSVALMKPMGEAGLALAASLTSAVNLVILLRALRAHLGPLGLRALLPDSARTLAASAATAIGAAAVAGSIPGFLPAAWHAFPVRCVEVGAGVLAGLVVYPAAGWLLGIGEVREAHVYLLKRLGLGKGTEIHGT